MYMVLFILSQVKQFIGGTVLCLHCRLGKDNVSDLKAAELLKRD